MIPADEPVGPDGQRGEAERGSAAGGEPAVRAARPARVDRHQVRVRRRTVRRVHGAPGRPPRALMPHAGLRGRGEEDHDHRGAGEERTAPPRPGRVPRGRSVPVRVLHAGHDRFDGRLAREKPGPRRGGHRGTPDRQHLPVRDVSADPGGGETGGAGHAKEVMRKNEPSDLDLEVLQHEENGRLHWFDVDRRAFLKFLGGGMLVCLAAPRARAQESGRSSGGGRELPKDAGAWLHIGFDGAVTAFTGKVEVGQNIRTSLAQQVAEELRVPLDSIRIVMGDTDLTPWDAGTFGSRTTPTMGPQLRAAAATAREQLLDLAAERWQTDRAKLTASGGKISNPATSQALAYGELTRGQTLVRVIGADPAVSPAREWKVAGRPAPKVDGRDFVTGKHQYTSDLTRPGMLHGKVLRPAGFKAAFVSLDAGQAEKIPGVRVVRDGDFVGVVAPDLWTAERAMAAIRTQWNVPPQPSGKELFEYLKKNEETGGRDARQIKGSVEQGMASADFKLAQTYTVEHIAHAPLEPRAAVAEWNGEKLTVWTGTQRPFAVRDELAEAFRISPERVRVQVPDTGSAYGGKHAGDAAVEAARLAKAAGKPVRGGWTREEEITLASLSSRRRHRGLERRSPRRHSRGLGVPQLHLRPRGHRDALRRRQPDDPVPSGQGAGAPAGLLPRARGNGESFRPRDAHGRARARRRHGSAGIPAEEHRRPEVEGGLRGGGGEIRLGQAEGRGRPGIRHRGRRREGRLRRDLRRGRDRRAGPPCPDPDPE